MNFAHRFVKAFTAIPFGTTRRGNLGWFLASCAVVIHCSGNAAIHAETVNTLSLATFRCDVTPPIGQPMFAADPLRTIEQPLLAKGIVLQSGSRRYVLCALDWCELCNGTHESFRKTIADAAGTELSNVAIQTLHQHTAPLVDLDAQRLLAEYGAASAHVDPKWVDEVRKRLAATVRQSLEHLQPFDQIGVGQAKVVAVASSRRCRDESGAICPRWSDAGSDPLMRALPEGTIDPYLKTITFAHAGKPLVRLHYYATHPQTRFSDGRATSDFPGIAREALERKEGVPEIYFTGCAGDITVGKYNDGSDRCRRQLAERLQAGMEAAIAATKLAPVQTLQWRTFPLILPQRMDGDCRPERCLAVAKDPNGNLSQRLYNGGIRAAFHQRNGQPIELSSLEIDKVVILNLPGEPLIDFQFYAQQRKPNAFVAVAGYGDGGPGYICTAQAFRDGGYEPTVANSKPETEPAMKKAIAVLLGVEEGQVWMPKQFLDCSRRSPAF